MNKLFHGPGALRAQTLRLIANGHRYSAFYQRNLSNHLPMALVALDRIGASDQEIGAFVSNYEKILEPLPASVGSISKKTTSAFLGRPEALTSWIEFFSAQIASAGIERITRQWVDHLIPGISGNAFHGLLRLAYATETGSASEITYALAKWASGYTTLGDLPVFRSSKMSPEQVLTRLEGQPMGTKGKYPGKSIVESMGRVKADPGFAGVVADIDPERLDTAGLAHAMLGAYVASGDFTMLHGITACHAFRTLTPLIKDVDSGRCYLWQALVCAYLSAGGPKAGTPLKGNQDLTWTEIHRGAAATCDEHDIKLAYTCWREWQVYGDDLYRRAASATLARQ